MQTRMWMLFGCLMLASCVQFTGTGADSSDEASTTTKPKKSTTGSTTPAPSSTSDSTIEPSSTPATAAEPAATWPVANGVAAIPVCFEQGFSATDRNIAENVTEKNWGQVTALQFIGWLDCDAGDLTSIRLAPLTDGSASHVEAMGVEALGKHVFLNTQQDPSSYASDVLHELGHIGGLGHEDLSDSGARAVCSAMMTAKGIANDLPGPAPTGRGIDDQESIMSRCRDTNTPALSAADIAIVARLYGVSTQNTGGDDFDD